MSLQNINMTLGQLRTKLDQLTTKPKEQEPPIEVKNPLPEKTTN